VIGVCACNADAASCQSIQPRNEYPYAAAKKAGPVGAAALFLLVASAF